MANTKRLVPGAVNDPDRYHTCPSCKRTDRIVREGAFATHDINPYMRMVCKGSGKPIGHKPSPTFASDFA